MLKDLTDDQRQLAKYMSELSEVAYSAQWMDGLELALCKAINGELKKYGSLEFTSEMVEKLKNLSQTINGWIIFDDEQEETFVTWEEWEGLNR